MFEYKFVGKDIIEVFDFLVVEVWVFFSEGEVKFFVVLVILGWFEDVGLGYLLFG